VIPWRLLISLLLPYYLLVGRTCHVLLASMMPLTTYFLGFTHIYTSPSHSLQTIF
jgi:hypothetical protein